MSEGSTIARPASAHLQPSRRTVSPIHSQQPAPVTAMSTHPDKSAAKFGHADRIRGGCIPCPDGSICYIIPIPCCC
ncbi:hypothetical protein BD309DRAFT_966862 [Dichomitus squalens]|uniref:Uncharacterized protein n=2 Tax=Dichomitus squalens TaxID=114155 RepID=A0A4Q9NMY6_9APHY|nr:uncharacterized protein DICSQDRAFT_148404 [Dichomitus squalens LYAD-421 SS1]EJF59703.1 hypothetical protein DICSQDRAFT_148404 [Dichomitus squalens LYAD-421 SS1]TBU40676.1 hypothetical protein BD309DRAFT_966862 [Dichomitus squalens]TBU52073.1 hypothetical protein BD310DRAFT_832959 [Dichomitus squalens]